MGTLQLQPEQQQQQVVILMPVNISLPQTTSNMGHNKEKYWLSAIRNINRQIMSDFKRRDPQFFEKIEKQQQSQDISNNTNDAQKKEKKQKLREQRWIALRQLAKK